MNDFLCLCVHVYECQFEFHQVGVFKIVILIVDGVDYYFRVYDLHRRKGSWNLEKVMKNLTCNQSEQQLQTSLCIFTTG